MDFPNVISPQASEMKLPVLAFAEQTEEEYLDASAPERDYATRITADRSALKDFLSRPVRIRQISWDNGSSSIKFNPWYDYLTDSRVVEKLNNFYNLRGTLCVKAVINGGPFLYGRLMMAYRPLYLWDHVSDMSESLVSISQWPRIFIDPTTSLGGTIKCPFFYFKEYLNVKEQDWNDMGLIYLLPMNELRSVATGVLSPAVTVTIYAWMENVEMLSPTEWAVTPQCGEIEPQMGEYGDSKASISTVATNIAQVAGALKSVPTIGPYALATQTMAKGVASVAKAFGYSAPLNLDRQVNTVKIDPKGATTNMQVPTTKMSVDVKQELTIDPQIAGVNFGDELSILSIAQRETYLDTFNWSAMSAPESNLYSILVLPSYCNIVPFTYYDGQPYSVAIPTALGFASMPFEYWSGSIKFRFQIVSSNFHKGRLAVVYDPAGDSLVSIGENTRFTEIIDISKTRDFTMTIDNNQQRSLLAVPPYPTTVQTYFTSTGVPLTRVTGDNGTLSVYVLNELQASSSNNVAFVQINVFVSAGDNFQLFAPTDDEIARYGVVSAELPSPSEEEERIRPQAGTLNESLSGDVNFIEETTAPVNAGGAQVELVPGNSGSSALTQVYIGETISSFRQLLHRQMYHHSCYQAVGRDKIYSRSISFFPYHRGCVPGATHEVDNIYYNFCANTIFNYLAPAFLGMRGGMRWKIVKPKNDTIAVFASRSSVEQYGGLNHAWVPTSYGDDRKPHGFFELHGINSGNTFNTGSTDTVLDIELPYYSNNKFFPCRWLNYTSIDYYQGVNGWRAYMDGTEYDTATSNVLTRFYTEVAEDFTFLFFLNAPPVVMNLILPGTQGD